MWIIRALRALSRAVGLHGRDPSEREGASDLDLCLVKEIPIFGVSILCAKCEKPFAEGEQFELIGEEQVLVVCIDCGAVEAFPELAG